MSAPKPCPACMKALFAGVIRRENVQPLSKAGPIDYEGNPWCHDCSAASTLQRFGKGLTWEMARTAVGNDRSEKLRLPGVKMGLEFVRLNAPGDLEKHFDWLVESGLRSEEF